MAAQKKLAKAVVPDDHPPLLSGTPAEGLLRTVAEDVEIYATDQPHPEVLLERIKDADAVINVRSAVQFPRSVLERCPKLKILSMWHVSVPNVNLDDCRELGITATNLPPISAPSVAEHTIAMAMAAARRIVSNDRLVRRGEWKTTYVSDLLNKTLGVIGAGPIGQRLIQLGKGIGMKPICWTLNPSPERSREYGVEFVSLDDLLRRSDVVALCVALSELTVKLIGQRELRLMKPSAILVNTGRGLLVDEAALAKSLREGRLAGAGADVFVNEPLEPGSPLRQIDNIILSPHLAARDPGIVARRLMISVENIRNFVQGNPTNVVVMGTRR